MIRRNTNGTNVKGPKRGRRPYNLVDLGVLDAVRAKEDDEGLALLSIGEIADWMGGRSTSEVLDSVECLEEWGKLSTPDVSESEGVEKGKFEALRWYFIPTEPDAPPLDFELER